MPILNVQPNQIGQAGIFPAMIFILTNDTLAEVTAPGYLNGVVQKFGVPLSEADIALVTTKTSSNAKSTQVGWFSVVETNGNWGLTVPTSSGGVILPTIANRIATYVNTLGQLSEDALTAVNGGSIQAGLSGTAGILSSFPASANNGSLNIAAVNAGGAFNTTISNGAMGQSTVYTLGDIGAPTGGIAVATSPLRIKSGSVTLVGALQNIIVTDAFCTSTSNVIGNFSAQTNAGSVLTILPSNGTFLVSVSGVGPGNSTFNYIIIK